VKHTITRGENQVAYYCAVAVHWINILSGKANCTEYGFVQVGRQASVWEFSIDPPLKTRRKLLYQCSDVANPEACKSLATVLYWIANKQQQDFVVAHVFE